MKFKLLTVLTISTLISCEEPQVLKKLKWNDYEIKLESLDGGATTSYYRKIKSKKASDYGESLIFESYSSPYITDIHAENNTLSVICSGFKDKMDTISIDLNHLEDFIDEPVKYQRDSLLNTNKFYKEPLFIKKDRETAKRYAFELDSEAARLTTSVYARAE
jgi:hypothetical protein